MNLAVATGFIMLAAFVVIIFKRWLSPFAALILCPAIAGLILLFVKPAISSDTF